MTMIKDFTAKTPSLFADKKIQDGVLAHHGSLYRRGETGFPTLGIQNGQIDLESVLEAPYGYGFDLDIASFTPLDEWSVDSLEIE